MHFFNPPVRMQLVEVISGEHTDGEVLDLTEDLAEEMGKTPVRVRRDSPGFIVNRVLVPLLNEAAWLVHEDEATIAEVDSTTKYDIGLPMGAFELADQVGIDVSYDVLDYMQGVLGDAYEPCPMLVEKVEAEELGKKTGKGFYDYENGGADVPTDETRDDVADRLTAVMANEVAKLVGNDVADPAEIDEAVMLGAGYPRAPRRWPTPLASNTSTRRSPTSTRRAARRGTNPPPNSNGWPVRASSSTAPQTPKTVGTPASTTSASRWTATSATSRSTARTG